MTLLAAILFATLDPNVTLLAPNGGMIETSLAVSRGTVVLAVINTPVPRKIDVFVSGDGARTWSAPIDISQTIGGTKFKCAFDPSLAVFDDGSFGLAYLVSEGGCVTEHELFGTVAVAFARSADGSAWSEPQLIASGPLVDKPWLSVDRVRGTAYLTWARNETFPFGGQDIMLARSTDRGATWSAPVAVTPRGSENSAQIGVVSDGTVVLTNMEYVGTVGSYVARVSKNGGTSFGDPTPIAHPDTSTTTPRTKTIISMAQMCTPYRADLYCAYPAGNGVFFTATHDGGVTWSAPLRLGGVAGDALLPSVAVEEASGTILMTWLDGRDDPSGGTVRLYAARSLDHGATFETPRAFSSPFAVGDKVGDYNSTVSLGSGLYATGFASTGGVLMAARVFYPPPRRRAANH